MATELLARLIPRSAGGASSSISPIDGTTAHRSFNSTTSNATTPAASPLPTTLPAPGPQSSTSSSNTVESTSPTPYTSPATSSTTTARLTSASSTTLSISQRVSTSASGASSMTSPTKAGALSATLSPKKDHQVADGAVAGAIVGVAVGIALITFLITFLFMRRKRNAAGRGHSVFESASEGPRYQADEKPTRAPMTHPDGGAADYERYLPPSADDKAVEQRTKNTLDQIELHVENYYQNTSNTSARPNETELASFNSPYLPESLASMLLHSRDKTTLIKHVLAYLVISRISPSAKPGSSLLPAEFIGLPSSAASTEFGPAAKPGFDQCISRWRVLSAYLRPDPSENTVYIAHRNRQVTELTQLFSRSLTAWKNPKYNDDERMRHLSAIIIEAVDLGICLFSLPTGFEFRWSRNEENKIEIAPALVKVTDERGHKLAESQVVVTATTSRQKF